MHELGRDPNELGNGPSSDSLGLRSIFQSTTRSIGSLGRVDGLVHMLASWTTGSSKCGSSFGEGLFSQTLSPPSGLCQVCRVEG